MYRLQENMVEGGEPSAEPAVEPSQPLLDSTNPEVGENEYFLTDGVKGVGDRPEWFKSAKYKSVSEQAKAYTELEKKFGAFVGAPKDGYKIPEGMDKEDALLQEVIKFGQETNLHQGGFEKLMELAFAQAGVTEQSSREVELSKLGEKAGERIKTVETYLKNKLKEDDYAAIMPMVTSAESIQLLEMMIKATQPAKLPIDGGIHPEGLSWEDVEREMFKTDENGNSLRSVSAAHEAKVQRMLRSFDGA